MASFNKVILIGNMVADPELKQTQSGISVCSFRIAVQRRFSKQDAGQQTADFIDIVTWRQQADFVSRYFKKGNPILVCGSLQTRTWTDNQGAKRYAVEVVADEVSFVAPSNANGSAPAQNNAASGNGLGGDSFGTPAFNNTQNTNFEEIPSDESLPF